MSSLLARYTPPSVLKDLLVLHRETRVISAEMMYLDIKGYGVLILFKVSHDSLQLLVLSSKLLAGFHQPEVGRDPKTTKSQPQLAAQDPLIKEYTLNHIIGDPYII